MKIVQILTHLAKGDAISNDVLAIDETLKQAEYPTEIMALTVQEDLKPLTAEFDLNHLKKEDLVLFHKSTGDALTKRIAGLPCKKGLIYHNITPARFFLPYDPIMLAVLCTGRKQLKKHLRAFDFTWGDSRYNCDELLKDGMPEERITVLPILSDRHSAKPDEEILNRLNRSPGTKLLFVGRISPNKKYEDIIKVYWYVLQKDPGATLYLVGKWDGLEKYYAKLKGFCADLKLTDERVVFTGPVSEEAKEAYLQGADALVCMSEHEGFCIPLMEAMEHDLPIVAYAAAAIPETLGEDHELLFREKDYEAMAEAILRLRKDEVYRRRIINGQRKQLEYFDGNKTREKLLSLIRQALNE